MSKKISLELQTDLKFHRILIWLLLGAFFAHLTYTLLISKIDSQCFILQTGRQMVAKNIDRYIIQIHTNVYIAVFLNSSLSFVQFFLGSVGSRFGFWGKNEGLEGSGSFQVYSSITALTRERELVSQSQFVFPSCLSQPKWPLAAPSSLER